MTHGLLIKLNDSYETILLNNLYYLSFELSDIYIIHQLS